MAEAVAAALFASWFAATVVAAFSASRAAEIVRRVDVLGLVPSWSFFAPTPGTSDYHLLARARRRDGSTGPFAEIAPPGSRLRRTVWNPEKRVRKAIFDCSQELVLLRGEGRAGAEYTLPYLTMLNLVTSEVSDPETESVQFLLLRSNPEQEQPKLLVRSRFHPVPG